MYAKASCALVLVLALAAGCAKSARQDAWLLRTGALEEARKDLDEAVALIAQLRYDQAAGKLAPLPEAFQAGGDPARAAEAMFWLAYCHEKQGRTDRAAGLYQDVVRSFPDTSAARQASDRLSRLPPL